MSATSSKTFLVCHGAWSAGWAWKKMHPLMQAAGHRLVTPTYTGLGERAHLAHPGDRSQFAYRGHAERHQVRGSARHRADRPQLWRHGRDRGRRPRPRQGQAADLYRRLRARDGQSLLDLNEVARPRMQELSKTGDGWRVPPNPTPPDTSPADVEWLTSAPRRHADQMLRDEAQAAGRTADAAAQLYLRHPHHAGRHVRAVRQE